jgi:tetratricopeptide (TPR) repeat protein
MKTRLNKYRVFFAFTLFFPVLGFAASLNTQLDSAANNYKAAQYEKSISIYENIVAQGYQSAELYFNLGNAYYKSNKFPMAIVNFERALKLNPNDEDIKFNLQLANTHVVDKLDVLPEFFLKTWKQSFVQILNSNQWAVLSLVTFIVGLGLLLLFFLTDKAMLRRFSFWIGALLIVSSILSFNYARKQINLALNEPDAIVITPSVVVKSSPDESGTELFLMHEGLKIKVTGKLGQWSEIKLSDGNKGWVKTTDFVVI